MVKFAVVGTNFITDRFLTAARLCEEFCLEAVYSRTEERARAFAEKWSAPKICTSWEEITDDPDIHAVYLASPNSCHAPQALRLLKAKKHVLCEKPMALSEVQLEEMLAAAQANTVVLLEAMRTAFAPSFLVMKDNLHKLGKIRRAVFSYCQYSSRYDKFKNGIVENAFNPSLGNGALMDIGVYCVHAMVMLFGKPERISAAGHIFKNSIDAYGTIFADYGDMSVQLMYSKVNNSFLSSEIQGEKGCMLIEPLSIPRRVRIRYNDLREEELDCTMYEDDMYYELSRFIRLIKTNESGEIWNGYSRLAAGVMDQARACIGIDFQ